MKTTGTIPKATKAKDSHRRRRELAERKSDDFGGKLTEQQLEEATAKLLKNPDLVKAFHDLLNVAPYRRLACSSFGNVGELTSKTADAYVKTVLKKMAPRDPMEEMLIQQALWTHARLANLSMMAADQNLTQNIQVVNEACDRAANTYRRQILALAEYRRPARNDTFAVIKQANLANQQVVNMAEISQSERTNVSNEQGLPSPAQLPPH